MQIRKREDMRPIVDWIIACCVLHNMLARLGDSWHEIFDDEEVEDVEEAEDDTGRYNENRAAFREELKMTTLRINLAEGVLPIP